MMVNLKSKRESNAIDALRKKTLSASYVLLSGDASQTPFLFNGMYGVMTDGNGLYHMRARFYSAEIRRFLNRDVLLGGVSQGQSLNRFAYTSGSPISRIDPEGDIWVIIGAVGAWVAVEIIIPSLVEDVPFDSGQVAQSGFPDLYSIGAKQGCIAFSSAKTWFMQGAEADDYYKSLGLIDKIYYEVGKKTFGKDKYSKYSHYTDPVEAGKAIMKDDPSALYTLSLTTAWKDTLGQGPTAGVRSKELLWTAPIAITGGAGVGYGITELWDYIVSMSHQPLQPSSPLSNPDFCKGCP